MLHLEDSFFSSGNLLGSLSWQQVLLNLAKVRKMILIYSHCNNEEYCLLSSKVSQ